MPRPRISSDIKAQILKRIREEGITVAQAVKEHAIGDSTIYDWLRQGVEDIPTLQQLRRLKRENEQLVALVGAMTLQLSRAQKKRS